MIREFNSIFRPVLYRPLALGVIAFIIGIVVGEGLNPPVWLTVSGIITSLFLALTKPRSRIALLSFICIIGFLSGIVRMGNFRAAKHQDAEWVKVLSDRGEKLLLKGKIEGPLKINHGRTNFIIDDISIIEGNTERPVPGKLSVWVNGDFLDGKAGDTVIARGKVKLVRQRYNPGVPLLRWSSREKVVGYFSVSRSEGVIKLAPTDLDSPELQDRLEHVRNRLRGFLMAKPGRPEGRILRALVIGDRWAVPGGTSKLFARIGTSHLLSLSGLHMSIVALFSFFIAYRLLLLAPGLALYINVRSVAAALCLVPLMAYMTLASPRLPTLRAGVVIVVYVGSIILNKDTDLYTTLSLAALIILAVWPFSVFDPTFILSFGSVLSIRYIYPILTQDRLSQKNQGGLLFKRAGSYFLSLLVVSVSVTLGLAPVTSYWFVQTTPLAPLANMILVPLYAGLVVPLGLVSVALLPVAMKLSVFVRDLAHWLIYVGHQFSQLMDSMPFTAVQVYPPSKVEMLLWWGTLLTALALIRPPAFLSRRALAGILAGLSIFWGADIRHWYGERNFREFPRLTCLDVGKGEATVFELPPDKVLVADAGGRYSDAFDAGESIVGPFLRHRKISRIVAIIASHPHLDHIGGIPYLIENFKVYNLFIGPGFEESKDGRKLINLANKRGVNVRRVHAGSRLFKIGECTLRFIGPPEQGFRDRNGQMMRYYANDNSLVFRVDCGEFAAVFTGDIEKKGERALIKGGSRKFLNNVTVIKLPHHGREEAISLTRMANPLIGIISGAPPKDGPLPALAKELKDLGTALYTTLSHGGITIEMNKEGLDIDTSRKKDRY